MNAAVSGQRSQSENLNDALNTLETFVHQARDAVSHPAVNLEAAIQEKTESMMAQISAQFTTLTGSITTIGNQLGALSQNLDRLGEKVDRLEQKVDRLEQKVDRNHSDVTAKIAAVDHKVDNLGRKLSYFDHNAMARVSNSGATKRNFELAVLLNVETGEEISYFPTTFGEADQLSSTEVTRILGELGLPTQGNVHDKKRRMMLAIGLTSRPL